MKIYQGVRHYNSYFSSLNVASADSYYPGDGLNMTSGGGLATVADRFYAWPICFPFDFLVKEYGVFCTGCGTAGGTLRIGLYVDGKNRGRPDYKELLYPYRKISEEVFTINGVGFKSKVLSTPILLKGGRLFWGVARKIGSTGAFNLQANTWQAHTYPFPTNTMGTAYHTCGIYSDTALTNLPDVIQVTDVNWYADLGSISTTPAIFYFRGKNGAEQ